AARKAAQRRSARRPGRRGLSAVPGAVKPAATGRGKARAKTKPIKASAATTPGGHRRGKNSAKAGIKGVRKRGGGTPPKPDRPTGGKTGPGGKKRGRRG